jgi:hypothetical protein
MHVDDVSESGPRYSVRRIWLPACATESFTVIGPDRRPVAIVDEYLAWLTDSERSPNTVEAYAPRPAGVLDVSRLASAELGSGWRHGDRRVRCVGTPAREERCRDGG